MHNFIDICRHHHIFAHWDASIASLPRPCVAKTEGSRGIHPLEMTFSVPGSPRNHHKSKEHIFLHRYGYPHFFSAHKKIQKIFDRKIFFRKKVTNIFSDFFPSKMRFSENQKFSIVFGIFRKSNEKFFEEIFRSPKKNFFLGVEIFWGYQYRCKKICSFDLWCFQSSPSTLSPPNQPIQYFHMPKKH